MVPERSLTAMPMRFDPRSMPKTRLAGNGVPSDAQCFIETFSVLAAGRGDIALAAATATHGLRCIFDEVASNTARCRRDRGNQGHATGGCHTTEHHDVDTGLAYGDGKVAQVAGAEPVDAFDQRTIHRRGSQFGGSACSKLRPQDTQLLVQCLDLVESALHTFDQPVGG